MEDLLADLKSEKAKNFVKELAELCERHGVVLSVSDYDGLQVWDRTADDPSPIHAQGIADRTGEGGRPERDFSDPGFDE